MTSTLNENNSHSVPLDFQGLQQDLLQCPKERKGLRLAILGEVIPLSTYLTCNALKKGRDCDQYPRWFAILEGRVSCNALKKGRDCDREILSLSMPKPRWVLQCPKERKGLRLLLCASSSLHLLTCNALRKGRDCDPSTSVALISFNTFTCNALRKGRDCDKPVELHLNVKGEKVYLQCPKERKGLRLKAPRLTLVGNYLSLAMP